MLVYLFRHGIAVDVGDNGVRRDADRMLSQEGLQRTEEAVRGMRDLGCRLQRVFASPLTRARETAEIVTRVLGTKCKVRTTEALAPSTDPAETIHWLAGLSVESVMLVGHLPHLADLAADLVSEDGGAHLLFKKAALARIAIEGRAAAGAGTLEWLIQPGVLRQLA